MYNTNNVVVIHVYIVYTYSTNAIYTVLLYIVITQKYVYIHTHAYTHMLHVLHLCGHMWHRGVHGSVGHQCVLFSEYLGLPVYFCYISIWFCQLKLPFYQECRP